MNIQKQATAVWNGTIKDGKGHLTSQSGVLKQAPYTFVSRFQNGSGTNPEELMAAAHAGCFTVDCKNRWNHGRRISGNGTIGRKNLSGK
ncbi:OsmC family peroxiredoxin [Parapedobacter deserti]|uniref:OsmC family peroxiredoxin n=1 Tax=Parapedobacter deserti TaxID=1912957 RepID=A0ABV7JIE2_9SPHI